MTKLAILMLVLPPKFFEGWYPISACPGVVRRAKSFGVILHGGALSEDGKQMYLYV